jgi:hypothetical protein
MDLCFAASASASRFLRFTLPPLHFFRFTSSASILSGKE